MAKDLLIEVRLRRPAIIFYCYSCCRLWPFCRCYFVDYDSLLHRPL